MNLNQVTVPSLDVEQSVLFYKSLGLKLIVESLPNYARFECIEGAATFSVHQVAELPTGGGVWVYFECENLLAKVDGLLAKGITFETLPENKPWLWQEARLKDPDDNQIILFFAGENRLNPPWRLTD